MNSKTLRRLAADHAALHNDNLPPNYLWPSGASSGATSDDLTQLNLLLAGPVGTPYSKGLWRLHLKIPEDYPRSPPKASFRTRIWHPNVEESTGSVCVDTLKRDWTEKVTLKDILITISCLLVYPNPDSALNSAAGALLQDDYDSFASQAKLMTSIHAPVPSDVKEEVRAARRRGEDPSMPVHDEDDEEKRPAARKASSTSSVTMKKKLHAKSPLRTETSSLDSELPQPVTPPQSIDTQLANASQQSEQIYDEENDETLAKENDPSLSPSPVEPQPESPRRNILGKRPLSDLPTPTESEAEQWTLIQDDDDEASANQENMAKGPSATPENSAQPPRKSPKLSERLKGVNASGRIRIEEGYDSGLIKPYSDEEDQPLKHEKKFGSTIAPEEKENSGSQLPLALAETKENALREKKPVLAPSVTMKKPQVSRTASGASTSSAGSGKSKPRTGLRRL